MKFSNKAVKGLIISDETILLLKRNKQEKDVENWDIPGGLIEPNENKEDALLREIFEETGLHMKQKAVYLGNWSFFRPKDSEIISVETYVFKIEGDKPEIVLSEEHSEFKWVSIENIRNFPVKDPSFYELLEKINV